MGDESILFQNLELPSNSKSNAKEVKAEFANTEPDDDAILFYNVQVKSAQQRKDSSLSRRKDSDLKSPI